MLVSLTVGKVDAGVAVLLTEDKRLIEFPSILLPPDITSGSIVDITVSRNLSSESAAAAAFASLQNEIYQTFGQRTPSAPILRCRNATQTSVVLEWDPIQLATAELRSLSLYRNGSKAGSIPRPLEITSTKISGLAVDTEYTFHLVLRTSAGTYTSEKLTVRTHKMTELSGITITPGIMPGQLRESLQKTVERIGAKISEQSWEKALEMNVPVVVPDWVKGCEREGRIVGVRGYYLNADPRLRQVGPGVSEQRQQQQQQQPRTPAQQRVQSPPRRMESPRTEITPPTPERPTHAPATTTNGTDGGEKEAPAPPPKDSLHDEEPPEKTSAAEEPNARKQDVKPTSRPPADDASDTSEETEKGDPEKHMPPADGSGERAPSPGASSFHEVEL
ncbi:hypothetical protein H2199_008422 [Coniosporium tulheliwenetii]|uniref:Uncharacterized protein n=1 Tax=Coniosporium tulheliwenetii TaxID=3383036 RepID=A0ACC2YJ92_9PEZI|nr:hypothetical protein H2199_008422 [Cladosporium sp. JES 115]